MVKLHEKTREAVAVARQVLDTFSSPTKQVRLTVDVNCPWTLEESKEFITATRDQGIFWLEEPIFPPEDFLALAELRRFAAAGTGVNLSCGENASGLAMFEQMIEFHAVDFLQPSVTKCGGVTQFIDIVTKLHNKAQAKKIEFHPHSPYFGSGLLATIHLFAALQKDFMPTALLEIFYLRLEASPYVEFTPQHIRNGKISVPQGRGLGVEPDEAVIRKYLTAFDRFEASS